MHRQPSGSSHREAHLKRFRLAAASLVASACLTVFAIPPAQAEPDPINDFGTINSAGQQAEHEMITRRALYCETGVSDPASTCFEPASLNAVAGTLGYGGAVAIPDLSTEVAIPAAHCDNADYLSLPGDPAYAYPQTRAAATEELLSCINRMQANHDKSVATAGVLVSTSLDHADNSSVNCHGVTLSKYKCRALDDFGRVLHAAQDFYSHSNYTDITDTSSPIGIQNPPGLNGVAPAPFLNLAWKDSSPASLIPEDLTTGCFDIGCSKRITHKTLNKDKGSIEAPPSTGIHSPLTPRGNANGGMNFTRAVEGAITETKTQWGYVKASLVNKYGVDRGTMIACHLTHDEPANSCKKPETPMQRTKDKSWKTSGQGIDIIVEGAWIHGGNKDLIDQDGAGLQKENSMKMIASVWIKWRDILSPSDPIHFDAPFTVVSYGYAWTPEEAERLAKNGLSSGSWDWRQWVEFAHHQDPSVPPAVCGYKTIESSYSSIAVPPNVPGAKVGQFVYAQKLSYEPFPSCG
ncbi:hypothetical protein ACFW0I_34430 [[Kitasatospora] papulosa]|uniref:hypothetical protein n=1 Tax=[Kitasatospora] papulosa TaxID=1464011 RepID=UPI0036A7A379